MTDIKPEKRLATAYTEFYNKLTEGVNRKFSGKTEVFVVGLTLGFLNNKRSKKPKPDQFIRYSSLFDESRTDLRAICEMVYNTMVQGNTESEKWSDFCAIADGGIEILQEHYNKNGDNIEPSLLLKDIEKELANRITQITAESD